MPLAIPCPNASPSCKSAVSSTEFHRKSPARTRPPLPRRPLTPSCWGAPCPFHWTLEGNPKHKEFQWSDGGGNSRIPRVGSLCVFNSVPSGYGSHNFSAKAHLQRASTPLRNAKVHPPKSRLFWRPLCVRVRVCVCVIVCMGGAFGGLYLQL